MDKVNEILGLIVSDINQALSLLDEVFGNTNGIYNDLDDKFVSRPENFSMETFRTQMIRFVNKNKKNINEYFQYLDVDSQYAKQNKELSDDHYYRLLCGLDFENQKQYFNNILKSEKQLIPFVVRAEQGFGQRWLCNRLIHEYSLEYSTHPPLILNFNELKMDLNGFINYFAEGIKVPNYEMSSKLDERRIKLKYSICKKLESKSQIVVIQDAYSFIHSPDFDRFYGILSYIDGEIKHNDDANHKCIFLFIEDTPSPYECEHFICATQTSAREARRQQSVKFIGLHAIQKLTNQCIETWLDAADDHICTCFEETNDIEKLISTHNGHPEKIIPAICEKIGIDYEENISKWLKY